MSLAYPLLGIERLTLDYYLTAEACRYKVLPYGSTGDVVFISKNEWENIAARCGPLVDPRAGGNVGNALTAYQTALSSLA